VREGERTGVQASLLGVGAPEALVIGVVALLVFGPKGLAEVLKQRAFFFSLTLCYVSRLHCNAHMVALNFTIKDAEA
jgi:hypothetical protein